MTLLTVRPLKVKKQKQNSLNHQIMRLHSTRKENLKEEEVKVKKRTAFGNSYTFPLRIKHTST